MPASPEQITDEVRRLLDQRLAGLCGLLGERRAGRLGGGKMLRTRLAARVAVAGQPAGHLAAFVHACAAVELVHTASLCHDDVIDRGTTRRGAPALWRKEGINRALLIGDMLLCEAFGLIVEADPGGWVGRFAAAVREVCLAEAEQELVRRGKPLDDATYLRLARQITGPFFAFPLYACAWPDSPLAADLQEAGYLIGTAYQLADDLLDVEGSEQAAGKTLGTDRARSKLTPTNESAEGRRVARRRVRDLCERALDVLETRPTARRAVAVFLANDLQPVLQRQLGGLSICARAEPR